MIDKHGSTPLLLNGQATCFIHLGRFEEADSALQVISILKKFNPKINCLFKGVYCQGPEQRRSADKYDSPEPAFREISRGSQSVLYSTPRKPSLAPVCKRVRSQRGRVRSACCCFFGSVSPTKIRFQKFYSV